MRWKIPKSGLIFLLLLVSILILHYSGILVPAENLTIKILSPVGGIFYRFGQKAESLWTPRISEEDYTKLESERNELTAKNVELQFLSQENEELRKALAFSKENQNKFITASIIGRDPLSAGYFVLNMGRDSGVRENYPVVSPEGVLVGKIVKAEASASVFLLPTDMNFQTAATILNKSKRGTSGLVKGEKGLGISMEFIPQDESIEKGDVVATSGLELNMPKGLVIGRVADVQKEARDIFGRATISPMLAYNNLSIVMVIVPQ